MAEEQNSHENTVTQGKNQDGQQVQFHVSPDLDYNYRDVFNIFVGAGDVLIEFGNIHRSMPNHATVSNRIVMSLANAYNLSQTIQQLLQEAHLKMQENMQKKSEQ